MSLKPLSGAPLIPDKYRSFRELAKGETLGQDYELQVRWRPGARVAVLAPHGGTIEPKTHDIARGIAGDDHSYYAFVALKEDSGLHIKSHLFDEPQACALVAAHPTVISIHGWWIEGLRVCAGGLDRDLIACLEIGLQRAGIHLEAAPVHLAGTSRDNITNRGSARRGVQLELSGAFRHSQPHVQSFIEAVRAALVARDRPPGGGTSALQADNGPLGAVDQQI